MIKQLSSLIVLLLLAAGCTFPGNFGPMGGPVSTPSFQEIREEFSSNGEMIFHTGYNQDGQKVPLKGGPGWIYMHGGACVTCHGAYGKGGGIPHMCITEAPSISYHHLTEEEHAEEEEEPHPPYTDETIKKAIKDGVNPGGEELDLCMPRWEMTDEDLDDTLEYLKTLEGEEEHIE
jgi:hypothetical protein